MIKHGVDLTQISRFANLGKHTDRLARKILHKTELAEFANQTSNKEMWLAVRWAIKEAVFKAAFPTRVNFKDIELYKVDGKPSVRIHTNYLDFAENGLIGREMHELVDSSIMASVSHDAGLVFASVIIYKIKLQTLQDQGLLNVI